MPGLPEITYRELVALLISLGCPPDNPKAPQLIGTTRSGKPYVIHLHPSQRAYAELVGKILKRCEISRDEFWQWYNRGR